MYWVNCMKVAHNWSFAEALLPFSCEEVLKTELQLKLQNFNVNCHCNIAARISVADLVFKRVFNLLIFPWFLNKHIYIMGNHRIPRERSKRTQRQVGRSIAYVDVIYVRNNGSFVVYYFALNKRKRKNNLNVYQTRSTQVNHIAKNKNNLCCKTGIDGRKGGLFC